MALSSRTISLGVSVLAALGLIFAAYALSRPISAPVVEAGLSEELLRAYASQDTDNDGLVDWKEILYGSDVNDPRSIDPSLLDGEAVDKGLVSPKFVSETPAPDPISPEELGGTPPAPGSLTDSFARYFFEQYISLGSTDISPENQEAFVLELSKEFQEQGVRKLTSSLTLVSLNVSSSESFMNYIAEVERVLLLHEVPDGNEDPIPFLEALIIEGDITATKELSVLVDAYARIAEDLERVAVPTTEAETHLAIVRSFEMLSKTTAALRDYEADPVLALSALGMYPDLFTTLQESFVLLGTKVLTTEGEPVPGTPGSLLISLIRGAPSL